MATTSIIKTLSGFSLFKGFSPEEIWKILSAGRVVQLKPEQTLISPGQVNNTLYLLIDGGLKVILEKEGAEVAIPIPPGECLGEMSLVGGNPTSARAIAEKQSRVLLIPEDVFWDQLVLTRSGAQNLLGMMAQRLQRNNDALIEQVEQQLQYQLMERELETAGKIQAGMVPNGSRLFPNQPALDAFALINQARNVGGDFYDAMPISEELVYFAVGDVSGKGMPAALFMMRILTALRLFLSTSKGFEEVVPAVNNWLARNNEDMMFVSLFVGVLHVRTGMLRYINAGHNPPFASFGGAPWSMMEMPKGPLLGISAEEDFPVSTRQLEPGDSLVLYTDGITEAKNAAQVLFDFDRLEFALRRDKHPSMRSLVRSIETAVERFVGQAPQVDDYTVMGVRWMGN